MPQAVRTYLEMTDPGDLDAAPPPFDGVVVEAEGSPAPSLWRFFYTEVGRSYQWVDRLGWSDDEVRAYLAGGLELWILRVAGEMAGYFELKDSGDGSIEIAYFGLLPPFV